MKAEIDVLLTIQEKDLKILEIKKKQQSEPQRIETMKNLCADKETELNTAKEAKKDLIVKKEGLENEVEALQEKINKCQLQLYQLKTNQEYRAMEKEIGDYKKSKSDTEDSILEYMEKTEDASLEIANKEKEVKEREAAFKEEKVKVDQELKRLEEEKKKLEGEKEEEAKKIEAKFYKTYKRIFKNKKGLSVVPVDKNICGGCHMVLPPNVMNEVMKNNNKIITCESCSRILYYI